MPIVYYDDRCIYCYNYVIWLIRHGLPKNYQFVPLKSDAGRQLQQTNPEVLNYNSVILQEGSQLTYQSTAIIKLIYQLHGYKWLAALIWLVPKPLRNLGYRFFAENRDRMWQTRWAQATESEKAYFIGEQYVDIKGLAQKSN
ncbi:thiol-disulfide oxidoreductase DCC family protein [Staphylococcus ratti]|uniref:DCC1-like thiol-disulfide oxidoreductase family protein n=1 Tax=Staphylococcus ratti TaxID=2892440 RepID=A0ABY3PEE9_9STAP|nr:DCC1-like thiol-disulfide oxidoreductase family protein [Staphylococcus ratti]UEX90659.1 DCC1-like thiol-disulfide oxidoreductase family protein [Staphylococcus ratti]